MVERSTGTDVQPAIRSDAPLPWRCLQAAGLSTAAVIVLSRSRRSWLRMPAAGLIICWSAGTHLRIAARYYDHQRTRPLRREVMTSLAAAFEAVLRAFPFHVGDIAIQAFLVRRTLWDERLERLVNVRLAQLPSSSGVTWNSGKGVIGRCWRDDRVVVCDLNNQYGSYVSRELWQSAPAEVKMGLDWEEVSALRRRYAGVVAVPFHDEHGRVAGVVTMDALVGSNFTGLVSAERALQDVVVALLSAACVIERSLKQTDRRRLSWT